MLPRVLSQISHPLISIAGSRPSSPSFPSFWFHLNFQISFHFVVFLSFRSSSAVICCDLGCLSKFSCFRLRPFIIFLLNFDFWYVGFVHLASRFDLFNSFFFLQKKKKTRCFVSVLLLWRIMLLIHVFVCLNKCKFLVWKPTWVRSPTIYLFSVVCLKDLGWIIEWIDPRCINSTSEKPAEVYGSGSSTSIGYLDWSRFGPADILWLITEYSRLISILEYSSIFCSGVVFSVFQNIFFSLLIHCLWL